LDLRFAVDVIDSPSADEQRPRYGQMSDPAHRLEAHLASPAPPGAFDGVAGGREALVEGRSVLVLTGSMAPVVPALARP